MGAQVVEVARGRGHRVVVLARAYGVDLLTGEGLGERLTGADTVVDVTNVRTSRRRRACRFFGAITGRLLAAEVDAGVGHHVALSIVGIDRMNYGYYAGKRKQEALVDAGPVPWSILRTTQFHEFAEQILEEATIGSVSLVPRMLIPSRPGRSPMRWLTSSSTGLPGVGLVSPGRTRSSWSTSPGGWPGLGDPSDGLSACRCPAR